MLFDLHQIYVWRKMLTAKLATYFFKGTWPAAWPPFLWSVVLHATMLYAAAMAVICKRRECQFSATRVAIYLFLVSCVFSYCRFWRRRQIEWWPQWRIEFHPLLLQLWPYAWLVQGLGIWFHHYFHSFWASVHRHGGSRYGLPPGF